MKILASWTVTQDLKKNSNIFALGCKGPVGLVVSLSMHKQYVNKCICSHGRLQYICHANSIPYFKQHLLHTLLQGGKSIPAFWVDRAKHSTALHSQASPAHQTTPISGTDRSRNQSESSTSSLQSTSYDLSSIPGLPRRFSGSSTSDLEYRSQLSSSCCTCQQHHHHGSKRWVTNRWRSSSAPVMSD